INGISAFIGRLLFIWSGSADRQYRRFRQLDRHYFHLWRLAYPSTFFLSKRERTTSARRDRAESPTSAAIIVGVNTDLTESSEPRSRTSPSPAPESEKTMLPGNMPKNVVSRYVGRLTPTKHT